MNISAVIVTLGHLYPSASSRVNTFVFQLILTANDKSHSFLIPDSDKAENIDRVIATLLTSLSETFPGIPL